MPRRKPTADDLRQLYESAPADVQETFCAWLLKTPGTPAQRTTDELRKKLRLAETHLTIAKAKLRRGDAAKSQDQIILEHMGLTDREIKERTGRSVETIRKLRTRQKRKKRPHTLLSVPPQEGE